MEVRILEMDIEVTLETKNIGRGRSRSRERQYSGNFRRNEQSSSRSRSGLKASTNGGRIRCFTCKEYDHFVKDCLNISYTEKEQSEQIQQMLNLEEEKTGLNVFAADTYDDLIRTSSEEAIDHLNLSKVRMTPMQFCLQIQK